MLVSLTQAGIDLLNAGGNPFIVTEFQFGDGFNYTPSVSDTNIHGTQVYTTAPNQPEPSDANTWIYSVMLDLTVGDFEFGEIGLRLQDGTLVALCAQNTLVEKIKESGTTIGNAISIDVYLRIQGTSYDVWIDSKATSNQYKVPTLQGVDQLPPTSLALPNIYILASSAQVGSSLAYTDRQFVWNFSEYYYISEAPILEATNTSVTIDRSYRTDSMFPVYLGEVITQFTDAVNQGLQGISRNVSSTVESGSILTFNYATPLSIVPQVGDTVTVYNRRPVTDVRPPPYVLPPATTTELGGVIVGDGLTVQPDGTLSTQALLPGGVGAPFYASRSELDPATGARTLNFSLPAGMKVNQPLIQTFDKTTGELILLPITNVTITTGQLQVQFSTSVAVAVTMVVGSTVIAG